MSEEAKEPELRFERSEGEEAAGEEAVCALCKQPIRNVYFTVGGQIACAACRGRILAERTGGSGPGRFVRAALFGTGAAIVGALLWYGVAKLTGYEFGLIAIVIGLMVGAAVRAGSRRRGGWRYQALAIFLTYTSIVSTYIPAIFDAAASYEETGESDSIVADGTSEDETAVDEEATGQNEGDEGEIELVRDDAPFAAADPDAGGPVGPLGFLLGLGILFGIAFIAPFLGGFSNFMGWIILAIGLYEAWKLNRREEISFEGPFRVAGARSTYVPETPPPSIAP